VRAYAATPLPLVGLPGSVVLSRASSAGLPVVREGFADRAYAADGTLVPRSVPGAVLADPTVVADRAVRMVTEGTVTAISGESVAVEADSLCVHGDSPGAVGLAAAVRAALESAGVTVAAFAP